MSNKLGLEKLILLNGNNTLRLSDLSDDTNEFFKKIAGYDTLRLLLSAKSILVEGDSDELVLQRAYMDNHDGKLPIHDGIDVISVGTSFLRFLEIANILHLSVTVVTDNDGDIDGLYKKYDKYLGANAKDNIRICFDDTNYDYKGELQNCNYNTLEPCIFRANSLALLNLILNKSCATEDEMLNYMREHKTEVALKIFESTRKIEFPKYIEEAISI